MDVVVRSLGVQPYAPVFDAMKSFTECRNETTVDEIWLLQHQPVFTQGRAGKNEHVLNPGDIPLVQIDRGGQVTFHGPGQLTGYLLIDIKRLGIGVRDLVTAIEESLVEALQNWGIESSPRAEAPGVYVDDKKIAALGLRIRKGCSYHGLSLNLDMDMEPWQRINACGLGVAVTQIAELVKPCPTMHELEAALSERLVDKLGYNAALPTNQFPQDMT